METLNLGFCFAVVILSCWWSWKTASRTPLFIGMAFGLFGISHGIVFFGMAKDLGQVQISIRIAAYAIVATSLFFIALEVMNRKKAEDELLHANENLKATNEQLTKSTEELRNNIEELQKKRAELLESEMKYRSIFNTLIDIYFQTDMDGIILTASPSLEEITGWNPDELVGKNVKELYPDEHMRKTLIADLKKNGAVRNYLVQLKKKDGRYIDVSLSGHIVFDDKGKPVRLEGTLRDVTERKTAEDALILAKKKLGLLNTVTFQDIQNAIFSLNGYFQLQQQHPLDETLQEYLNKEMDILGTISDSLKFAGQYQNLGQGPPCWQNVHHAFLYGISHLDLSKYSRTIRLEGLELFADPMLENVFFTLTENVVMYAKTSTELSLTYQEDPEGLVLIFSDNGPGIVPKMKEKIFERHYERKRGIGLFLAREILSITGITIHETGEPGAGARFEIRIPKGGYRFVNQK